MRFAFIISKLGRTGPSATRLRLAQGLVARGHDVRILTFTSEIDRMIPPGVVVESLGGPRDTQAGGHWGHLRLAWALRRWMRAQGGLDFLSSSLTVTDRVLRLSGIRNGFHWVHVATSGLVENSGTPQRKNRRKSLYQRIYGGARVIGVSQGVLDDLAGLGAQPRQAELVYNPFDVAGIRALAAEPVADLPPGPFVLHAGRVAKAKRYDVLFESFGRSGIPHRLVLLTAPHPDLTALIDRFGLQDRVMVAGFRQNPYAVMARAAALVLSSDREGFGNVLVESLIAGTPVISSDCRYGPSEILTGPYARWLSPVDDAAALAQNLRAVVETPYPIEPWLYERFTLYAALDRLEAIAARGPRPSLGPPRLFE